MNKEASKNNNKLSGKLELNWVNKNKTLIVKDYEKICNCRDSLNALGVL